MGFELDESVDDLGARTFEIARPTDIGLLVEPRLEFDQRGHRLAGFGGLRKRAHDRTVLGGAVERLLDRHHVGIMRRLLEELHHHVERLIRMMDDKVLLANCRETIAGLLADALGKSRIVGHEFKIRAIELGKLRELHQRQRAVDQNHFVIGGRKRALDKAPQLRRHRGFHLQPNNRSAPAAF